MKTMESMETSQTVEECNEGKTRNKPSKQNKNPKRVEAGKRAAESRKAKCAITKITKDTDHTPMTPVTEEQTLSEISVNVYKNYIPLCFVGVVGGLSFMYIYLRGSSLAKASRTRPDQNSSDKPAASKVVRDKPLDQEFDPFDFIFFLYIK